LAHNQRQFFASPIQRRYSAIIAAGAIMESYRIELFVLALAALLAPLLSTIPNRFKMPVVVAEILLGILIGPQLLNWLNADGLIGTLGELGLTFLLFMVGMEIKLDALQGKPLLIAGGGWLLSFALALLLMYLAHNIGWLQAPPLLAALMLSTTALGVLIPILRDSGQLTTPFGKQLFSVAMLGELGPLLILSLLVFPSHGTVLHGVLIAVFVGITVLLIFLRLRAKTAPFAHWLKHPILGHSQWTVRLCIALQAFLIVLAGEFGLNVVVGAFAAGMVVGLSSEDSGRNALKTKLDAIGYGFLIPIFFIAAGMKLNIAAVWADAFAPLKTLCLLALLLIVRGLPLLLYKAALPVTQRLAFVLYSATGLPLIVVFSELAVEAGLMPPEQAALIVAAGMISVLLFPIAAEKTLKSSL
jgi:Kef-type K+ transport system membrane component KefB